MAKCSVEVSISLCVFGAIVGKNISHYEEKHANNLMQRWTALPISDSHCSDKLIANSDAFFLAK